MAQVKNMKTKLKEGFYLFLGFTLIIAAMTLYDIYAPKEYTFTREDMIGYYIATQDIKDPFIPNTDQSLVFYQGSFSGTGEERTQYAFAPTSTEPRVFAQREVSLIYNLQDIPQSIDYITEQIKADISHWKSTGTEITDIYFLPTTKPDIQKLATFSQTLRQALTLNYRLGFFMKAEYLQNPSQEDLGGFETLRSTISFLGFFLDEAKEMNTSQGDFITLIDKLATKTTHIPYCLVASGGEDLVALKKTYINNSQYFTGFMQLMKEKEK